MNQTLDQKRAEAAFRKVEAVAKGSRPWAKDYGRQCRRLPALILQTGLCQAAAFLQAKAHSNSDDKATQKDAFANVLADLESVMGLQTGKLAERARTESLSVYRRDSIAALHCAQYLKRYSEAFNLGEAA